MTCKRTVTSDKQCTVFRLTATCKQEVAPRLSLWLFMAALLSTRVETTPSRDPQTRHRHKITDALITMVYLELIALYHSRCQL